MFSSRIGRAPWVRSQAYPALSQRLFGVFLLFAVVAVLAEPCFPTVHSALPSGLWRLWRGSGCQQECHPASEGIELDPFHVSGSSDSCCSMEMAEKRDPIKVPSSASFQQPMPQCPPLSSPDSSVHVVFFSSQSPLAPQQLQLGSQRHFSERWAWENSESRCILEAPPCKEHAPCWAKHAWVAGSSPWFCGLPGREERNWKGKYFLLASPLHD